MSVASPPLDGINTDALGNDLERINADLLTMLASASDILAYADVKITDAAQAAGKLCTYTSAVLGMPMLIDGQGQVTQAATPGSPAQWVALTNDQYAALRGRIELLRGLVALMDVPMGEGLPTFAAALRAHGRRWEIGK